MTSQCLPRGENAGWGKGWSFAFFMKKFAFRMETVRRLREQEEQMVRVELASALRDRSVLQERLDRSRQAEADLHAYMRSSALTAADLRHVSKYDELHRQKIIDAIVQLSYADQAVERIRARLVEAQAAREALDRLKDRHREAHRQQMLAEEAKELDEIGTMRHRQNAILAGRLVA